MEEFGKGVGGGDLLQAVSDDILPQQATVIGFTQKIAKVILGADTEIAPKRIGGDRGKRDGAKFLASKLVMEREKKTGLVDLDRRETIPGRLTIKKAELAKIGEQAPASEFDQGVANELFGVAGEIALGNNDTLVEFAEHVYDALRHDRLNGKIQVAMKGVLETVIRVGAPTR